MVMCQPIRNLWSTPPPTTVFLLCLLSLSVTFVGFGLYARSYEVRNPDVVQDWNKILGALSQLQLCVSENGTDGHTPLPDKGQTHASSPMITHDAAARQMLSSSHSSDDIVSLMLHVPLTLDLAWPSASLSTGPVSLRVLVWGSQLDLKGMAGNKSLCLTLMSTLQPLRNGSDTEQGHTCITITAPAHMLPGAPLPGVCEVGRGNDPILGAVASALSREQPQHTLGCYRTKYTPDPRLTIMLSPEERYLAGQHLIIVGVFLLSLCGLLCLAAPFCCVKSRRQKSNELHVQKEPLIDS
ncbi:transmembrane protein 248 isoform X2 [Polyodon spathula]|nr:transmembrane protein 248 isoform X2 [Polyodon spathula]XP_041095925.1 transmembrane protein 248 isoform X2 [Polyodon spathula]XP_041095926.1 transmembrane protein 248 isoform X2 [Polyodon spathula]XP_041095927.1 transmembrane protein 248 isoform X2 [Polyodon spathula]